MGRPLWGGGRCPQGRHLPGPGLPDWPHTSERRPMTHRRPRGEVEWGARARATVSQGLLPMPASAFPARRDLHVRPGARVSVRRCGRASACARLPTAASSRAVLHHAPRRACREPKWTPGKEPTAWVPARARTHPRPARALARPGWGETGVSPPVRDPRRIVTRRRGPRQGDSGAWQGGRAGDGHSPSGRMRAAPRVDWTGGRTDARNEARACRDRSGRRRDGDCD